MGAQRLQLATPRYQLAEQDTPLYGVMLGVLYLALAVVKSAPVLQAQSAFNSFAI